VPIKSVEQQAAGMVLKARELLVRQRSQAANALRGHMAERGLVAAMGMANIGKLITIIRSDGDHIAPAARTALKEIASQIEALTVRIEKLERNIISTVKGDEEPPAADQHSGCAAPDMIGARFFGGLCALGRR
tara:strand:- start:164 stop:562 length:399 start_codon:yes stop_codon:yes gene_type:complete